MEASRTYRATAIVLRRINIGETDRVITLYTREKGKLSAVAKGSRRPLSKLAAATEPFNYGRYFIASGKDLDVVTQAEGLNSFPAVRKDLDSIARATYMIELTNALVEEREPNHEMFDTLLSALYVLENGAEPDVVARYFDLQVMSISGYQPEMDCCLRCGERTINEETLFSPSAGGTVCGDCGPVPEDVIPLTTESANATRLLMQVEPRELVNTHLEQPVMDEISRAIRWYVRYRLDKEIKSIEFIQSLEMSR